jgi:hypothetical protein
MQGARAERAQACGAGEGGANHKEEAAEDLPTESPEGQQLSGDDGVRHVPGLGSR